MNTFTEIEKLITFFKNELNNNVRIIAIDGIDGSGKSYLTTKLAPILNAIHINLDDFLISNKGGFLKFIKYSELAKRLSKTMQSNCIAIVEGVCVLQVLEKIEISPQIHIYIKEVDKGGFWLKGIKYYHYENWDSYHEKENYALKKSRSLEKFFRKNELECDEYSLLRDRDKYHFDYKPHLSADIIFERIVTNN